MSDLNSSSLIQFIHGGRPRPRRPGPRDSPPLSVGGGGSMPPRWALWTSLVRLVVPTVSAPLVYDALGGGSGRGKSCPRISFVKSRRPGKTMIELLVSPSVKLTP